MKKKILFYYPSNKRSVQIETTLREIKNTGHAIYLLTTCTKGAIHDKLESFGISVNTSITKSNNPISYYLFQIVALIKFCRKHKIDIVFSNLQHTNFIAALAQYFMKAKVVAFRHHFKFSKGNFGVTLKVNKNEQRFDFIINKLSKHQVVPSKGVYDGIMKYENVDPKKIEIIPYIYDFNLYPSVNQNKVDQIKAQHPAKLRLIMVARLIPFKRHFMVLPIIQKLISEGFDLHLFILDEGPEEEKLKSYCTKNKLNNHVSFIGYTQEFLEYMCASDLLIHPSLTEASNNVVKEIGLLEKAVAVCKGVGDFDDYLRDGENGFLMDLVDPSTDIENILRKVYNDHDPNIGMNLRKTILEKFNNNEIVLEQYISLIQSYS